MRLYYLCHTDDDGEQYDLIVWAHTPLGAIELWQEHFDPPFIPGMVFEIPQEMPAAPKVLTWHEDMRRVS